MSTESRRRMAPSIILLSLLLSLVVAAPVAAKNPPGNNGTVKIDGFAWDSHPNNEPHVGCEFQVDFYGFDRGDLYADVVFEAHPPTGRGVLRTDRVFIGEDAAGGGTDLDAEVRYNLTQTLQPYTPHPVQGYDVKLTIMAEGFQKGAGPKHKVFWVGPCAQPPGTPSTNPPTNPPGTPPTNPPVTPPGTPPTTPPSGGQQPREDTAGGSGGAGGRAPVVGALPDTAMGASSIPLTLLAGTLLLGGSAGLAVATGRRNRSRR